MDFKSNTLGAHVGKESLGTGSLTENAKEPPENWERPKTDREGAATLTLDFWPPGL
jgi:hypothetical protein